MSKGSTPTKASSNGRSHLNEVELAELLNLSSRTLQGWRLKGGGPAFEKFGRAVRYSVATVAAWIADRERDSTSASGPPNPWGIPQTDLPSESEEGEES